MVRAANMILALLVLGCAGGLPSTPVLHIATLDLTEQQQPALAPDLLAELQRSPLWAVHEGHDGHRTARLRTVTTAAGDDMFITQWLDADTPPVSALGGGDFSGDGVVSLTITVTDAQPEEAAVALTEAVPLSIYGRYSDELDGNSFSVLVAPLAAGLWLRIREQGPDPDRGETRASVFRALHALEEASEGRGALMRTRYAALFDALGGPGAALRYEGIQHRDALGRVLEIEPGRDYDGVLVRVFDDAVCGGECTVGYRQAAKADRLGAPLPGDLALVLVEDCAVLLSEEADQEHGIFTGSAPFPAEIRWQDAAGEVLVSERGPFWGWQR